MSQHHELYRYAAPGARVFKQLQTGTRQHQARYLAGLELRTSTGQQPLLTMAQGHSRTYRQGSQTYTHFNLCDRLNSVCGAVDACGNLVSRESWYPFGGTASWLTVAQAGAVIKFQRYAGKERDVTGLIFYGWRYYVPWLMRWLSHDPAGTVDGLNLFRMVGNNPVTLLDLDGRMYEDESLGDLEDDLNAFPLDESLVIVPEAVIKYQPLVTGFTPVFGDDIGLVVAPGIIQPSTSPKPGPSNNRLESDYRCSVCNLACDSLDALTAHQKQEHGNDVPYRCVITNCGKQFKSKYVFRDHLYAHGGGKKYSCKQCDKAFVWPSGLSKHVQDEHSDTARKYTCSRENCGRIFKSKYNLDIHITARHTSDVGKYKCDREGCDMAFHQKSNLKKHILSIHLSSPESRRCLLCNKEFRDSRYLSQHIRHIHKKN